MTTMLLAAAMLAGAGTTAQAAAKNIDTRDNISLWVGDSRTVLIYQDLNMKAPGGVSYRSKARVEGKYLMLKYRDCYAGRGTGYSLVEEAIPVVENVVSEPGRQNVVFNSGVNDLYNTELNEFYTRVGGKRVPASPETLAKQYWKLYKKTPLYQAVGRDHWARRCIVDGAPGRRALRIKTAPGTARRSRR